MTRPGLGELLGGWALLPAPVAGTVAAAALYAAGVRAIGPRWPAWRSACFATGIAALAWALCSGLHTWGERWLSVHMVQHLVLALVVAPLLVAGAPDRLALRALHGPARRRLARVLYGAPMRALLHPATAVVLFAGTLLATHLTGFYALTLRNALAHDGEHAALLWTAVALFASLQRTGAIGRLVALTAATIPMGVIGAWLAWAPGLRYPSYRAPGALDDQALAAAIMWVGASLPFAVGAVGLAGIALWQEEARQRRREALLR
jgi:cytochrome c oxidase assembly factor CtaG